MTTYIYKAGNAKSHQNLTRCVIKGFQEWRLQSTSPLSPELLAQAQSLLRSEKV